MQRKIKVKQSYSSFMYQRKIFITAPNPLLYFRLSQITWYCSLSLSLSLSLLRRAQAPCYEREGRKEGREGGREMEGEMEGGRERGREGGREVRLPLRMETPRCEVSAVLS